MRGIASERLEDLLRYWQDTCWYFETLLGFVNTLSDSELPIRIPDPVRNWRRFEGMVFDNTVEKLEPKDWLLTPEEHQEFPQLGSRDTFPFEFFKWSRKSRRVFHLPRGLHQALAMAALPNIRWDEVVWPFDSFMITLEEPILAEDKEGVWSRYDAILVTKFAELGGRVRIRLMCQPHAPPEQRRLSPQVVLRARRLFKRGNLPNAVKKIEREWESVGQRIGSSPGWRSTFLTEGNTPLNAKVELEVENFAAEVSEEHIQQLKGGREEMLWRIEPLSWAAKIVVGWCLYLEGLSSANLSWKTKERKPKGRGIRGLTGVILNTEHICTIIGHGTIDPSTYGLREPTREEGSTFFVRPHWRRRHRRREIGSPPTAPKTILIHPMLIREDLIPIFGIIGGTNTDVEEED